MPKVLLLNPPANPKVSRDYYCGHVTKGRYYWPQTDLLVASGMLHGAFDVHVLDAVVENLAPPQALERIARLKPDAVVAMTAAVSWSADMAFLAALKAQTPARIVIGGDCARAQPAEALARHACLDGVIVNFADCDLREFLAGKAGPLKNLATREAPVCRVDEGGRRHFHLPVPRHDLFPLPRYHLPQVRRHPFSILLTDFGCPYRCSFCYFERIPFYPRDLGNLAEELDLLGRIGVRELVVQDTCFGTVREHAFEVCRLLRAAKPGFSWICSMRVDAAEETLLRAMRDAGCHLLQIGVESGTQAILDKYVKRITLDQTRQAFALAKRLGLRTLAHFLLGLEGEDQAALDRTLALSLELNPTIASFNLAMPAYNTSLRDTVTTQKLLLRDGIEPALEHQYPVWQSTTLTREALWATRNRAMRNFYLRPGYIFGRLAGTRSAYEFQTLVREGCEMLRTVRQTPPQSEVAPLAASPEVASP